MDLFSQTTPKQAPTSLDGLLSCVWAKRLLQAIIEASEPNKVEELQKIYNKIVPHDYRKTLGQFFTPSEIAKFMVSWAITPKTKSLLDPAMGLGIFIQEALRLLDQRRGECSFFAYEIDPLMIEIVKRWVPIPKRYSFTIYEEDFVTAQVTGLFDAVVCNPPYIRHHELTYPESIFAQYDEQFNIKLSRLSNIYILFFLKIYSVLSAQGRAALITPTEYLNSNFGTPLKRFLLEHNALDALIIFDHSELVFDDILTTGCITLLRKDRKPNEDIRVIHASNSSHLNAIKAALNSGAKNETTLGWSMMATSPAELNPAQKWANGLPEKKFRSRKASRLVPMEQIAQVMRGIATGANNFFTLTKDEIQEFGIKEYAKPCITKAHFAPYLDFTSADFQKLVESSKKTYLLDFKTRLSPEAVNYIKRGESLGIHRRFLNSHRTPWYAMEKREPAPIYVNVFARGQFRFVLNRAKILSLTCFHYIYPKFSDLNKIKALLAYLNCSIAHQELSMQMRKYADGLIKYEPGDIRKILVPDMTIIEDNYIEELASLFDQLCIICRKDSSWQDSRVAQTIRKIFTEILGSISR